MNNIDIAGIGDKTLPTYDHVDMGTMDEYIEGAKKMISSMSQSISYGMAGVMLRSEDAIANVAHAMMMADWQFNGNGSRYGFRKERAMWAIKNFVNRKISDRKKGKSVYLGLLYEAGFDIPSNDDPPDKIYLHTLITDKMNQMVDEGLITKEGSDYVKLFYLEEKTAREIGEMAGISKQAVHQMIQRTVKIMRETLNEGDF